MKSGRIHSLPVSKYHGLGNDYLVIKAADSGISELGWLGKRLCLANYGLGADGLLVDCSETNRFAVRIFNPDGSEAEKSGNGLRIFARYLYDQKKISHNQEIPISTKGGMVSARVLEGGSQVIVAMGRVVFAKEGEKAQIEKIKVASTGEFFACALANIGNPHCVALVEKPLEEQQLALFGRYIETLPRFAERTNVQFMRVLDKNNIALQIWERGAGITLASGSSSAAAAAVAYSLGFCDNNVTAHMPGGSLKIRFDDRNTAYLQGAVTRVFTGQADGEALKWRIPQE